MRSRSSAEWAGLAFGAAAQAVWCGVLAGALSGGAWPVLGAFAAAAMLAAAVVTDWTHGAESRLVRGRAVLVALVLLEAALLLVTGRAWAHEYLVWQIVRDLLFVAGVTVLGVYLGAQRQTPDDAVRRAVRAFALVCAVLAAAAVGGAAPAHAAAAVAAVMVAGALHVVAERYVDLSELMPAGDRLPVQPWLLAVAAVVAAILVVAAFAGLLLDSDVLHRALGVALDVISYAAGGVAWVVGWAGVGVTRLLSWLGSLVGLHVHEAMPPQAPAPAMLERAPRHTTQLPAAVRLAIVGLVATAGVAASLGVLVLALRRLHREASSDERVVEERETVRSLGSVAAGALGAAGRGVRRLIGVRRRPASADEIIRLEYARLEARLAKAGAPRGTGETVRAYLAGRALASGAEVRQTASAAGGDGGVEVPAATEPSGVVPAAELAGLYEIARYAPYSVGLDQARRFEDLALDFPAPVRAV